MTLTRLTMLALVAGIASPAIVVAQRGPQRPIELGMDAAVVRESGDLVTTTAFTFPVARFRVGFFMTDAVSLEPMLALSYGKTTVENPITGFESSSSGTSYDLNFGLLYHFQTDRSRSQAYIRPFVGVRGFSSDSEGPNGEFDNSASQASFGVALGFKVPATPRVGTRFELGFQHRAEDEPEFDSSNVIFLSLGLSFFTR